MSNKFIISPPIEDPPIHARILNAIEGDVKMFARTENCKLYANYLRGTVDFDNLFDICKNGHELEFAVRAVINMLRESVHDMNEELELNEDEQFEFDDCII